MKTEDIITVNLKYSSTSESLIVLSYEELIEKALISYAEKQTLEALGKSIAELLGVRSVSSEPLNEAIKGLLAENRLKKNGEDYVLTEESRKRISEERISQDKMRNRVLARHFKKSIPDRQLKGWFVDAVANFFGEYSNSIIESLTRNKKINPNGKLPIEELLKPTIISHKLEEHLTNLITGFENFILSEEVEDAEYITSLTLAMFSARLIASDIGADPLAIKRLETSILLLDTNALLTISLERRLDAKTLQSLGGAIKDLKIKMHYIPPTSGEYLKIIDDEKNRLIDVVEKYPKKIVEGAKGDFAEAAFKKGATTPDDIEAFFKQLREDFPPTLEGAEKISQLTDAKIEVVIEKSENDTKLAQTLIEISKETSLYGPKGPGSAQHDAALVRVVEYLQSNNEEAWILTTDRAILRYSDQVVPRDQKPLALSFDVLLSILAIREAGTKVTGAKYAPLLARMLRNRCMPSKRTYTVGDLEYLSQINEKAVQLPAREIERIANGALRQYSQSGERNDHLVRVEVDRAFRDTDKKNEKVEKLSSKLREMESRMDEEHLKTKKLSGVAQKAEEYKLKRLDIRNVVLKTVIVLIITASLIFLLVKTEKWTYSLILSTVLGILGTISIWKWPFESYKRSSLSRSRRARDNIKNELKRS